MLIIDGSYGEGGGQIIRSALSLSCITGQPIKIENIRAKRPKPGLSHQHLSCVRAAVEISGARVEGAAFGSRELTFFPVRPVSGKYRFDIGTAGSVSLVIQTIIFPLLFAKGESEVVVTGGTHVPWSPCFHYLDMVFRPVLEIMGIDIFFELKRWGWYPRGGGEVRLRIAPVKKIIPFQPHFHAQNFPTINVISASSHLPVHVRKRQSDRIKELFAGEGIYIHLNELEAHAFSPGSLVFCYLAESGRYAGYTGIGARGKPAEMVAEEPARDMTVFLRNGVSVDERLSDQLIIPALLAEGESSWTTLNFTRHLRTNIWLAERFCIGEAALNDGNMIMVKGIFPS